MHKDTRFSKCILQIPSIKIFCIYTIITVTFMNGKLLLKTYHIFYYTLNITTITENTALEFDC